MSTDGDDRPATGGGPREPSGPGADDGASRHGGDPANSLHGAPLGVGASPVNRLAAEIRQLAQLVVGRPLADADVASAADALAGLSASLEASAGPGKRPRSQPDLRAHPQDYFPTSPMVGYANPIAPPVDVWAERADDGVLELHGRVTFGYPYEGPPTCVHGGVVAELFDELLGAVNISSGRAGMTGTLTVRYRKPTPLMVPLDLVARQTSTEGRKLYAWGGIFAHGVLTAEAEGVFIEMRPQRMLDIVTANAKETDAQVVDPDLVAFVERGGRIVGAEGTLRPADPSPS